MCQGCPLAEALKAESEMVEKLGGKTFSASKPLLCGDIEAIWSLLQDQNLSAGTKDISAPQGWSCTAGPHSPTLLLPLLGLEQKKEFRFCSFSLPPQQREGHEMQAG